MKTVLLVIFLIYMFTIIVSGLQSAKKYRGVAVSESQRLGIYILSMLTSWIASFAMALTALIGGITPAALGIRLPDLAAFLDHQIFSIVAILTGAAALGITTIQCVRLATSERYRADAWAQLSEGAKDGVLKDFTAELVIPRSRRERQLFPFVALTAGFCEEFIMRGVSFALILTFFPRMSPFLFPVLTAVLFGFGHAYQGVSGIVKTTAAGLLLGVLYLATGSLFPVMVLHFVIDLTSQFLSPEIRRSDNP